MNDRLYRSVNDRVIAGVCGGLAVRMSLDPSLVRIGYAVVALVTGIFPLLVLYVIMAAVVPEEPAGFAGVGRSPVAPGPDAVPGWTSPGATAWPPTGEPEAGTAANPDATMPGSAAAQPAPAPTWAMPAARRRRDRDRDPVLAVVGGLALVGLGVYLLVRDRLSIDWSVVGAASIVALGVVVTVAALRPRR